MAGTIHNPPLPQYESHRPNSKGGILQASPLDGHSGQSLAGDVVRVADRDKKKGKEDNYKEHHPAAAIFYSLAAHRVPVVSVLFQASA